MSVLSIRHLPDDLVLRQKAKRVPIIDPSIRRLIDDMIETMEQSKGVGLAAPQIGVSLQVIVLQMPDAEPFAVINPEIVKREGVQEVTEGCLSIPSYYGEIKRPEKILIKGKDRHGKNIRIRASGLLAEALEHEIDHLNGRLYIDHIESLDKLHKIE